MEALEQQFNRQKALRRRIMRRVWCAYSLSIASHPAFLSGFVFGASAIAFWRLVSIMSIIHNLLATRLGELPSYAAISLEQADRFALVAFILLSGITCLALLRVVHSFVRAVAPRWLIE